MKKLICIVIASVILVTMNIGIFALENSEPQNNKATFKLNLYEFNESDRTVLYNKPLDPTNIPIGTNVAVETVINNPNAFAPNGFMSLCYSLNYNSEYMTARSTFLGAIEADGGVFQEGGAYTSEIIDKNAILSVLTQKNNYNMQLHNMSLDTNNKQLYMLLQNSVSEYNASEIINGSGDVKISTYYFKTLKAGNCTLEFESNINSKKIINWLDYQNNSSLNTSAGDYIDDENATINPLSALNITIADLPPTITLNDGNALVNDPMYVGAIARDGRGVAYFNPYAVPYNSKDHFIYYEKDYTEKGFIAKNADGTDATNVSVKVRAEYDIGEGNKIINTTLSSLNDLTTFFKTDLAGKNSTKSIINYMVDYTVTDANTGLTATATRNVHVIYMWGDANKDGIINTVDLEIYKGHVNGSARLLNTYKNDPSFDPDFTYRIMDIDEDTTLGNLDYNYLKAMISYPIEQMYQ